MDRWTPLVASFGRFSGSFATLRHPQAQSESQRSTTSRRKRLSVATTCRRPKRPAFALASSTEVLLMRILLMSRILSRFSSSAAARNLRIFGGLACQGRMCRNASRAVLSLADCDRSAPQLPVAPPRSQGGRLRYPQSRLRRQIFCNRTARRADFAVCA